MKNGLTLTPLLLVVISGFAAMAAELPTLEEAKVLGRKNSVFPGPIDQPKTSEVSATPQPELTEFRARIAPALKESCVKCHGPEEQNGKFRVDTLNPNQLTGPDIDK